jgi:cell pole-organizing protein PopZ
MEDLLASIRRAIGEEGADLPNISPPPSAMPLPARPPRHIPNPSRSRNDRSQDLTNSGGMRDVRSLRDGDRDEERPHSGSMDLLALRGKIDKELRSGQDRFSNPSPMDETAAPGSPFRGILGGREDRGWRQAAVPPPARAVSRSCSDGTSLEESLSHLQPVDRSAPNANRAIDTVPRSTAFDIPARGTTGLRPPYGNGSFGIRGFSPPESQGEPGMMSPESGSLATGAFHKLADTLLQRGGERSIDDLIRELLRPMLKEWLDRNLPRLVEDLVREEIERVARRAAR